MGSRKSRPQRERWMTTFTQVDSRSSTASMIKARESIRICQNLFHETERAREVIPLIGPSRF